MVHCSYCGAQSYIPHRKYADRCEECGKRYAKYTSYKSQQRIKYSAKRERLLDAIILEYRDLKFAGYKVPRNIT